MNNKNNKINISSFNIKDKSEEGIKLDLSLPDGTKTEHYLIVRGADSPTFRRAQACYNRKNLDALKLRNGRIKVNEGDIALKQAKDHTKLVAELIVGWSFDEEFCSKNVVDFLEGAPQIEEQVNQVAAERERFFSKPSTS